MGNTTSSDNQTRAGNTAALERASGRPWPDWVTYFSSRDAASLPHAEIARLAAEALPESLENPGWWAQAAAIAYEQHVGLRVPGQSSTGTFRVSASRTLGGNRDDAISAWEALAATAADHLGHTPGEPRLSRTEKRSFWRVRLDGAGRVEVSATPKSQDRVTLAISHDGLPAEDHIEAWRSHWKAMLARL